MLIQILITALAVFALVRVLTRFRRSQSGRGEFVFWIVFWVGVIALVWNPSVTNILAAVLGVGRGADAMFYVAIILLFFVIFKLYGRIETLEHKLSELVKAIALKGLPAEKEEQDKD